MRRIISTLMLCLCAVVCLYAQEKFIFEGSVDSDIADSCFNVYIGDEYFHIDERKADMCVPVVDKKFRFEIACDKVKAGAIRGILPGGKDRSANVSFFIVPGETLSMSVDNDYFEARPTRTYYQKTERAVVAARNANPSLVTPYTPKLKGKKWTAVTQDVESPVLYVKDVVFGKDETVLHIMSDLYVGGMGVIKDSRIEDENGNKYELIRADVAKINESLNPESRVYGGYYAFKPVGKDVKSINLFRPNVKEPSIANIRENTQSQKPNFNLHVTVSPDITDCSYLIYMYDKKERTNPLIAEIPVDNKQASYSMHLDETRLVSVCATFPDGSVCRYSMRFPFVPGESAELTVKNGCFYLNGSDFYKQWGAADVYIESLNGGNKQELIMNYLKEHSTEKGCISFYTTCQILPLETIVQMLPESILSSEFGIELLEKASREEASRRYYAEIERKAKERQKNTQEGMKFVDFSADYDGKTQRLSDYVGKGKYVLVDFWASWCAPCREEIPNIKKVWEKYKGEKFEVLGVASMDKPADTFKAVKELDIEYPQIVNAREEALDSYGIMGIPTIILFGPDGTIIKRDIRGAAIMEAVKECMEK